MNRAHLFQHISSLIILFFGLNQPLFSQPVNNDCTGAIPIQPTHQDSSCSPDNFNLTFSSSFTTSSGYPVTCNYYIRDQWFYWLATSDGLRFLSFSPGYPSISIYTDCYSAAIGIDIACAGYGPTNGHLLSGWNIGDYLLIQISTPTSNDVSFCLKQENIAINDLCDGAIPFVPTAQDSGCDMVQHKLSFSEGTSASNIPEICGFSNSLDLWFYWIATSDALRYWSRNPGHPGITLYRDCEEASMGIDIGCVSQYDNPTLLFGWHIGDTLLIRILSQDALDEVGFCLEEESISINNDCHNAIPILPISSDSSCNSSYLMIPFSKEGSTISDIAYNCGSSVIDQWFTWRATSDALYFKNLYGNINISIYEDCTIAESDTYLSCLSSQYEGILSGWNLGDSLLIRVGSRNGTFQDISLCLQKATLATNNSCSEAIPVDSLIGYDCDYNNYSTLSLTESAITSSGVSNNCGSYEKDLWFTWVAIADALRYERINGYPGITIFYNCSDAEQGLEIDCSSWSEGQAILSGWKIGDSLLIQLTSQYNSNEISFCLEVDTLIENNDCHSSLPISPHSKTNECNSPKFKVRFDSQAISKSDVPVACGNYNADVWYHWIATSDALRYSSFSGWPSMTIYSTCDDAYLGSEIDCAGEFSNGAILSGWSFGDTLLIQVRSNYTTGTVEFCLEIDTLVSNNDCSNALPIQPQEYNTQCANPQFFIPFHDLAVTHSGINNACRDYFKDQWYYWIASSEVLSFIQGMGSSGIVIFENCEAVELEVNIDCSSSSSGRSILSGWNIGDTLLIQLYSRYSMQNISFCLEVDTLVPQDMCTGAIPISPSPSDNGCDTSNFFHLPFWSQAVQRNKNYNSCAGSYYDQWFTWTATSQALRFEPVYQNNMGMSIFYNCAGAQSNSLIDCVPFNSGGDILYGWNAGDSLLIQVFSNSNTADLYFCLEEETLAPNDLCSGALPILPTQDDTTCRVEDMFIISFDSLGVTQSSVYNECDYQPLDLWYQWVATSDALRFSPKAIGDDGIGIFSSCEYAQMGQSIDCSCSNYQSEILKGWSIGDTLLVQILKSNSSSHETIEFCLQEENLAINNDCAGATPLAPKDNNAGCLLSDYEMSFKEDGLTESGGGSVCADGYLDQWFTWTATSDALRFWNTAGCSAGMAIYFSCSDFYSGNLVDCDRDFVNSEVLSGWEIGDDLLLQIFCSPEDLQDIRFCIELENLASNNRCMTASDLNFVIDTSNCTNDLSISFIDEGVTQSILPNNCFSSIMDRWYKWTATSDELLFSSFGPENPKISIFPTCIDAALGNEIICVYGGSSNIELSGWNIGDELLIQLSVYQYLDRPVANFCLKFAGNLLPVELTNFRAEFANPNIHLNWTTASEINNDRFEIEKSSNGVEFKLIGSVPGHINSSSTNEYNFIDESPFHGLNYYRLKQVDRNGAFEYSDIVSAMAYTDQENELLLYPNPLSKERIINIKYMELNSVKIFNSQGQIVYVSEFKPSSDLIPLNLEGLSNGYYILVANDHIRASIILH